ncbi:MAG: hypothetical protein EP299_02255 [Acidobacteria bacterium]|nr:MAG: hypothetical protein EP299_02255 [Acidobacteriota bacterium]
MSTQITWVHGNCGHLQEIDEWGESTPSGWGLFLEGETQEADNHNEPWVHFHLPLTSQAVEGAQQWPRLRKVMLQFTTDYEPPIPNPEWIQESDNYYKYPTDDGGAFITQLHIFDGHRRIFAENDLKWHSPSWDVYVVESLSLPKEIEIRHGLGVTLRIRFKDRWIIQKLAADPVGDKNSAGKPVSNFKPQHPKFLGGSQKRCFLSSVGCEFLPASP